MSTETWEYRVMIRWRSEHGGHTEPARPDRTGTWDWANSIVQDAQRLINSRKPSLEAVWIERRRVGEWQRFD